MDDPDVALMLRVRDGDEDAFTVLFDKHSPRVLRFIRRNLGDVPAAEDLAQDVFVQLYDARKRYRPDARFTTFLYTIALNACRNERRRREHFLRVWLGDDDGDTEPPDRADGQQPTSEEIVGGQELERALQGAFQRLPEKQRSAFLLSRVDGLAYRDVAEVMDTSEGAVKALIHRATRKLRRELKGELEEKEE